MSKKKKSTKKLLLIFTVFLITALVALGLLAVYSLYVFFTHNSDRPLPIISNEHTTNSSIITNMNFYGAAVLNGGRIENSTYKTTSLNLDMDANFSIQAMCGPTQYQTGAQKEVGKLQQLNVRQCLYEPTGSFHCYLDKAQLHITSCPKDSQGKVRDVKFSLEKIGKGIYPVVFSYDKTVPSNYQRNDKNYRWIMTSLVKPGTLDSIIKTRQLGTSDFYKMECGDNVTFKETCNPENFLYYKPQWAKEFYIVEYLGPSYFDIVVGQGVG